MLKYSRYYYGHDYLLRYYRPYHVDNAPAYSAANCRYYPDCYY